MANQNAESITLPKALIRRKQGVAILPLEEYERIKEDLEMLRSRKLAKEIKKARKEAKKGKVISLEELERKLNL
jgi:PHD/YefM family antitoxin component YafN of YafNO toxin-antitoxin module